MSALAPVDDDALVLGAARVDRLAPATPRASRPSGRFPRHASWGPPAVTGLSLLAMASALQVWGWRPGTPVDLSGDAVFYTSQVRSVLDNGALATDEQVGAPFGQVPGLFTTGDDLHLVVIRALGLVSDSPFTVAAVYFFLGFPLAALTAYWLARRVGVARAPAVVVGTLFSVVPAHQTRYAHLFLAAYWGVPLGMWLVLTVARGRPVFHRFRRVPAALRRRTLGWNTRSAAIILTVGLSGVYYAAFTAILLVGAVVVRRMRRGDLGDSLRAMLPVVLLVTVTGTSLLRARLTTRSDLVSGTLPGRRTLTDTEVFSGKPLDLVLPWVHHRDAGLAQLSAFYNSATTATAEPSALGVVAGVGVVGLLLLSARLTVRGRRPDRSASLVTVLGLLVLLCLAFYVRGGLNSVVALFLTPQLRTWSRMSLLIALLGLLMVGLLLTRLTTRWGGTVSAIACAVVVTLGVWDQTNPAVAPDWAAQRTALSVLTAYTDRLESVLPPRCAVFEAPVMRFPENGALHGMSDYDPLKPSLTSRTLRWSYGAMRGTARGDWQLALPQDDVPTFVDDLAAAGFCALQVDHAGYAGDDPAARLRTLLGPALAGSTDGRLETFPLSARYQTLVSTRGAVRVAARGRSVLHPVVVDLDGPASPVQGSGTHRYQWLGGGGVLVVGNLTASPQDLSVDLRFSGVDARPRTLTVTGPDGLRTVVTTAARTDVPLRLRAAVGVTRVELRVDGPGAPTSALGGPVVTQRLQVVRAIVRDPSVAVGVVQQSTVDPGADP